MSRRLSTLRALVTVLAAVCVLLAGVAPSVSRVLAASATAAFLHDVCSSDPGGGPAPGSPGQGGASHHAACGFCVAHGGTHAAPPPSRLEAPLASADAAAPVGAGRTSISAFDWNAAAPRGPPGA